MDGLRETQAVAAFLHILEALALDGEVLAEMRSEVAKAPYMTTAQRKSLDSFLGHIADREWVLACNDMYAHLEGIFWEAGIDRNIVTRDRKDPAQPTKELGFETMVKRLLASDQDFATWITRALYGTQGNPFRHGGAVDDGGHREKALFGLVALSGWLQTFAGVEVWDSLIDRSRLYLSAAVEQVQITAVVAI